MVSDDVYRSGLRDIIVQLEDWARATYDCADIEYGSTAAFWKMTVEPKTPGACPFQLLLRADQKFDVAIAGEAFDGNPVSRFDFFTMLAEAIAAGRVERVDIINALTGARDAIETRVTLSDGWAWVAERRLTPRNSGRIDGAQELRTRRFLPYRR